MVLQESIRQINKLICEIHQYRNERIALLEKLANEAWELIFPEDKENVLLKSSERKKRWQAVESQIEEFECKEEIQKVLQWPASGGNFYWLK